MMPTFGLIGKKLGHSFSKGYFTNKFQEQNIDSVYELYELPTIEQFEKLKDIENLVGLNVTIPYKQEVIPFLDELDPISKEIGAVNTIKFEGGKLKGYNSDYYGFRDSLLSFLPNLFSGKAIILGSGGASKAVQKVLSDLKIEYILVSRNKSVESSTYEDLNEEVLVSYKNIKSNVIILSLRNLNGCK